MRCLFMGSTRRLRGCGDDCSELHIVLVGLRVKAVMCVKAVMLG